MKQTYILIFTVFLSTQCKKPSEVCFTYTPSSIKAGETILFDSGCSKNASYFTWNFGENEKDTIITSSNISHQFRTPSAYEVSLEVKRKDGV